MNSLTIIGNLTKDPERRTTSTGKDVCTFTVAVNRRKKQEGQPDADFFRVTAWNNLAEICAKYLTKGRKVCVIGPVGVHTYTNARGEFGASLELTANDVEFLSASDTDKQSGMTKVSPADNPFTQVTMDKLPWE